MSLQLDPSDESPKTELPEPTLVVEDFLAQLQAILRKGAPEYCDVEQRSQAGNGTDVCRPSISVLTDAVH